MNDIIDNKTGEIMRPEEATTVELLNKSEIDTQIATAKKYPRSIEVFHRNGLQMVTLDEGVARESIYALPARRGSDKAITGPSVRFAEMVQSAWGNCRSGARVIHEGGEFITAQGIFFDLERNSAVTFEVQRRIVDRNGRRFNVDMIGVTANAACSVALRNAILKGVPKALWKPLEVAARKTIAGDTKSFKQRCDAAIAAFEEIGVKKSQVFGFLDITGAADLTVDHLIQMSGMLTAIEDGEMSLREIIMSDAKAPPPTAPAPTAPEPGQKKEPEGAGPMPEALDRSKTETKSDESSTKEKAEDKPAAKEEAPAPEANEPAPSPDQQEPEPELEDSLPDAYSEDSQPSSEDAPEEPEDSDERPGPGHPDFDFDSYQKGVEDEMACTTTFDDLDEIASRIEADVYEHIPQSARQVFNQMYKMNRARLRKEQSQK